MKTYRTNTFTQLQQETLKRIPYLFIGKTIQMELKKFNFLFTRSANKISSLKKPVRIFKNYGPGVGKSVGIRVDIIEQKPTPNDVDWFDDRFDLEIAKQCLELFNQPFKPVYKTKHLF